MKDANPPLYDTDVPAGELAGRLSATWSDRPGFRGWLSSVDHKSIARRYLITAGVFFGCLLFFFAVAASTVETNISARSRRWRVRFI